jgi:hypothetical protein
MAKLRNLCLIAIILFISPTLLHAGDSDRESLKGLTGVRVLVENINPEAERGGLSAANIQTDMELMLRKAGIRVLSKEEWSLTPGLPSLYVKVVVHKRFPYELYVYGITVGLEQVVMLSRNMQTVVAPTWSTDGAIGTVGVSQLSIVRDDVKDEVDKFINAFLAENPKR